MNRTRVRRRIVAIAAAGTAAALIAAAPAAAAGRPGDNTSAAKKAIVGGHAALAQTLAAAHVERARVESMPWLAERLPVAVAPVRRRRVRRVAPTA